MYPLLCGIRLCEGPRLLTIDCVGYFRLFWIVNKGMLNILVVKPLSMSTPEILFFLADQSHQEPGKLRVTLGP